MLIVPLSAPSRPAPPPTDATADAVAQLSKLFRRNGYLRMPNLDRRSAESRSYKKGYEVRFTAGSVDELETIRALLKNLNFPVANAYQHHKQWRQPLYGHAEVIRFVRLIGRKPDPKLTAPKKRREKKTAPPAGK